MKIRIGELYCGPGGLGLAAKRSRFRDNQGNVFEFKHVWATDIDEDACSTYRNNILKGGKGRVICEDVRNLDFTKFDPIDILTFGFPCNDFSLVGEQKGFNGSFGPLYTFGVKALNELHPSYFLAENVSGLGSSNEGQAFKQILSDLHHAGPGYKLYPHLYKFELYGVPQARHRIIIIGVRNDLDFEFKIPAPNGIRTTSYDAIMSPPTIKTKKRRGPKKWLNKDLTFKIDPKNVKLFPITKTSNLIPLNPKHQLCQFRI